jgi:sec-independent protein translocase protein TatC
MMVVFELPVFMVGLTRLGIMTTNKLRKNRRMGYFLCGVVGMAVAPSVDPVTTTLQALPLFILFEGSIWLSVLLDRRATRLKTAAIQA